MAQAAILLHTSPKNKQITGGFKGLNGVQEVAGSNPVAPTNLRKMPACQGLALTPGAMNGPGSCQ